LDVPKFHFSGSNHVIGGQIAIWKFRNGRLAGVVDARELPCRTVTQLSWEENMRNIFVALLMLAASPAIAQDKEKLSATDLTVRTALTFKVADAAVQKLLPAGFELNSPTAGPSKGSNLNVTLIDYF
jgi:hypothetical protein